MDLPASSSSDQDSDERTMGEEGTEVFVAGNEEEGGNKSHISDHDTTDSDSDVDGHIIYQDELSLSDDDLQEPSRYISDKVCHKTQEWNDISASESDSSSSDGEISNRTNPNNPGWAKAMQKILSTNKPSGKKSVILSKAEKISKVVAVQKLKKETGDPGFEVVGDVKEEKDEKPDITEIDTKPKNLAESKVRPSFLDRERERRLNKTATKGVVQLFNAVRNQQKEIKRKLTDAGGRVRKEDKVIKSLDKHSFVNMLMGNSQNTPANNLVLKKDQVKHEEASDWSVLQDNFMTGGNLKNWDKNDVKEELDEVS